MPGERAARLIEDGCRSLLHRGPLSAVPLADDGVVFDAGAGRNSADEMTELQGRKA